MSRPDEILDGNVNQGPLLLLSDFIAEFKKLKVGHYVVNWRVKLLKGFCIPNGLLFSVAVSYDATDISGSFDVALSPGELEKLANGDSNGLDLDLDLELEELVVIQPHEWDIVIKLSLSNTESERRLEHLGLQVDFVEIRPFTADENGNGSELPKKHIVERAA
ncbi:hypothetical protein BGZ65_003746, partial [Modicella reniformis]